MKLFKRLTFAISFMFGAAILLSGVAAAGNSGASVLLFDNGSNSLSKVITTDKYVDGDIDGDGVSTVADALALRKHLAGISPLRGVALANADVDLDGCVNTADMLILRKVLLDVKNEYVVRAGGAAVYYESASKTMRITASGARAGNVIIDLKSTAASGAPGKYVVVKGNIPTKAIGSIRIYPVFDSHMAAAPQNAGAVNVKSCQSGFIAELTPYEGKLTGIMIGIESELQTSVYISEFYVANSLEDAETVYKDRISTAENATPSNLRISSFGENPAIRLLNMTSDDKTNTNGGMYHDFKNSKWPSIAVDENDRLYVVASGGRMAHVDPFGATVMVMSDDGGESWSKPSQINNTVMDDRDAGILYLGAGKMLVSYFTSDASSWLPGGSNYDLLKPYSQGGQAPTWAAEWDSAYNPVGGIIGTHLDILRYIKRTDSGYDLSAGSYLIKSTDGGESWNTSPYSLKGSNYTYNMNKAVNDFRYNKPGTRVPVTSCHGPTLLSDGTIIYAGKVMDASDAPVDSMAVYKSADSGDTWSYLSQIPVPAGHVANNFHELSVTERTDGVLVCAIRAQSSGRVNISPSLTVYICYSYDSGASWTKPVPCGSGFDGAPPHLLTMDNGNIVMTYSCRTDPRRIFAVVSTDGGITWSERATVASGFYSGDDMGYPASVEMSDGTICTVYYGTYHPSSANEGYSSILFTRWSYRIS